MLHEEKQRWGHASQVGAIVATAIGLIGCLAGEPADEPDNPGIGVATDDLTGGTIDPSSAFTNAVVSLNITDPSGMLRGHCTGVLVAPDVVLTSGHCVYSYMMPWPYEGGACTSCPTADYRTCTPCEAGNPVCPGISNCVTNDIGLINGSWHTFSSFDPNRWEPADPLTVKVGGNRDSPVTTRQARWFNSPQWVGTYPFQGHADIILIGLTGGGIPSSNAIPRDVWTTTPPGLSSTSQLGLIGFSSTFRQRAYGRGYTNLDISMFQFTLDAPASAEVGDSGGAVLFGGINGNVMGVNQSDSSVPRVVRTFSTGGASSPNLAAWLFANAHRSLCSATQSSNSVEDSGTHVKLMGWWSTGRSDNFVTTQAGWNGCYPNFDRIANSLWSYDYFRLEGWVERPDLPQPAGTVALNLYWNASSLDNAALTAATAPGPGWGFATRLGWIYTASGANRVALHAWFNSALQDFFTTTQTIDYTSAGYTRVGSGPIGFVRTATSFTQRVP